MRVGIDISSLRFPHTGIAVYTAQLIRALQRHVLSSDVELTGFSGLGFRPLTAGFAAAVIDANDRRGRGSGPWRGPLLATPTVLRDGGRRRRLLRFVKEGVFGLCGARYDLFHATVTLPPGRTAKPLIPLVHDLSLLRHPKTHPAERVRAFERWLPAILNAPRLNTVSAFSRSEIVTLLGIAPERVAVTHPGVDPFFFAPADVPAECATLARFGVRRGGYLLAVGSLEPRKNLAVAMTAFAALPSAARGEAALLVVGPPGWGELGMPAAARRLCESGAIRFTGYVDRPTLRTLYGAAALLVYPSIYEGFGIPAAEALACGTAVAASRGTSLEEVVGPHGVLLAHDDVEGWRDAMQAALDVAPGEAPAQRAARRAWAAQFDWDATAAATLALYRAVLFGGVAAAQPAPAGDVAPRADVVGMLPAPSHSAT